MSPLEEALAARINPERSRAFSRQQFEANRIWLGELARELVPEPGGLRISVVGSNGKGSVAWYLERLFAAALARSGAAGSSLVGRYTSPHLIRANERIAIDGQPLDDRTLLTLLARVATLETDERRLSYFEMLTLMAWVAFQDARLPVHIYEAGLGGRLDATRVSDPQVIVLTAIAREHTELLGEDPRQILREKLGIAAESARLVIVGPQELLGEAEVRRAAAELCPQAELVFGESEPGRAGRSSGWAYPDAALALARTSALAILAHSASADSDLARVGAAADRLALEGVASFPRPLGRMECRSLGATVLCYDTAHNPAALEALLTSLETLPEFPGSRRAACCFGVLADRDPAAFRTPLETAGFANIVQVAVPPQHALPPDLPNELRSLAIQFPFVLITGTHRLYELFDSLAPLDFLEGRSGWEGRPNP